MRVSYYVADEVVIRNKGSDHHKKTYWNVTMLWLSVDLGARTFKGDMTWLE